MKPDPVDLLVSHLAAALVRHGMPPDQARLDAEERVAVILEDLARSGAPVGQFLRRVRVYRLRCQGLQMQLIADRLGIHRTTAQREYRAELMRRRAG